MSELIECANIRVDCVRKSLECSQYSSEDYYGFNFNVKTEELDRMGMFIYNTLEKYEVPLISMYIAQIKDTPSNNIDSINTIDKAIKDSASLIIEAADKYYEYMQSLCYRRR